MSSDIVDNAANPKGTAILWLPVACPSCGNNQATPPRNEGETQSQLITRMRQPMDLSCFNCKQPMTATFVGDNK